MGDLADVPDTIRITARNVLLDGRAAPLLRERGWRVVEAGPGGAPVDDADAVVALVVGSELVDGFTLDAFPNVVCIVRAGSGTDNIRLPDNAGRVSVASIPGVNAQSVADYAFGLILASARRIVEADRLVRAGRWSALIGSDVYRRTLGIVGFGAVGRAVAARATGFEMNVLAYDPTTLTSAPGVRMSSLAELLETADVVSLHAPLTKANRHMIGSRELALMKPTATLVNTARGELVDEGALLDALRRHVIAGAALDVFEDEPNIGPDWRELENVVLSPHHASFGSTTMDRLATEVADAVERLVGEPSAAVGRLAQTTSGRPS